MFDNIKVGTKLIGSFLAVVVILMVVTMIGYSNIKSIAARAEVMYSQNTTAIEELGTINTSLEKMRGDIYRYFDVPADRPKMAQSINETIILVNEIMENYKKEISGTTKRRSSPI